MKEEVDINLNAIKSLRIDEIKVKQVRTLEYIGMTKNFNMAVFIEKYCYDFNSLLKISDIGGYYIIITEYGNISVSKDNLTAFTRKLEDFYNDIYKNIPEADKKKKSIQEYLSSFYYFEEDKYHEVIINEDLIYKNLTKKYLQEEYKE